MANECLMHSDGGAAAVKACCPSGKAVNEVECVTDGKETFKRKASIKTFPVNGQIHKDILYNAPSKLVGLK